MADRSVIPRAKDHVSCLVAKHDRRRRGPCFVPPPRGDPPRHASFLATEARSVSWVMRNRALPATRPPWLTCRAECAAWPWGWPHADVARPKLLHGSMSTPETRWPRSARAPSSWRRLDDLVRDRSEFGGRQAACGARGPTNRTRTAAWPSLHADPSARSGGRPRVATLPCGSSSIRAT